MLSVVPSVPHGANFSFLVFPYFFVHVPCARLSWPSRQLLRGRISTYRIVSYKMCPDERTDGQTNTADGQQKNIMPPRTLSAGKGIKIGSKAVLNRCEH